MPMAAQLRELPQESAVSAGMRPPARARRAVFQVAPFQVRAAAGCAALCLEVSAVQDHGDPQASAHSSPQAAWRQAAARPAEASCQVLPQSRLTVAVAPVAARV